MQVLYAKVHRELSSCVLSEMTNLILVILMIRAVLYKPQISVAFDAAGTNRMSDYKLKRASLRPIRLAAKQVWNESNAASLTPLQV